MEKRLQDALKLFDPDGTPKPQWLWETLVAELASIEPVRERVLACLQGLVTALLQGDEMPQHKEML
jgi:hypothetical protein